jgi:competence protein ComEA
MEKMIRFAGSFGRAALAALALGAVLSLPHDAEAQRRPAAPSADEAAAPAADGVVNIQTASVEELQRLPGIGPSKAQAIVAFRERTPFRRVEDILRVRGIGRATFRRLRPMLSVTGPTTLTTDVRMPRAPRGAAAAGAETEEASED